MQAYRLIKKRYADDPLSPQGAKLYGGRWNSKGNGAVYVSDSVALAVLEILVHLRNIGVMQHFMLCEITLDEASVMTLDPEKLPDDWQADSPSYSTMSIGDEWLSSGASLALAVPSTIVPEQNNLIINPAHDGFEALVSSISIKPFSIDHRLVRSQAQQV